ncbi:MAG TPA: carboxypeptidase-like regulatory domain-containing protein [Planctomycetota bacterium]|nr:carboxypeptidase-like regulatory domain-containing protein [Planctomycetota bacterium]
MHPERREPLRAAVIAALLWSTLWGAPLASQVAEGVVRGFDGALVAGAVVVARTAHARETGIDALTDKTGRFRLVCPEAIVRLHVQFEGVRCDVPVVAGNALDVAVSFAQLAHFTLRGRVVLPDGAPAAGVELKCRDREGQALAPVTAGDDGAFSVRLNQPVHDVLVDPLGWRHVVSGPVTADHELVVDLRNSRDSFFAVSGSVCDERGEPVADGAVQAVGSNGGAGSARTRPDGSFVLWTNRAVDELHVTGTDPRIVRKGPWSGACTVALDARTHGLVLRVGRCVDEGGKGLAGAIVFAVDKPGPPKKGVPGLTRTGSGGWFRVMLPRDTAFLFAIGEGEQLGGSAPVPAANTVIEVRATKMQGH